MTMRWLLLSALAVTSLTGAPELETWTDVDGRPVQARLVGIRGDYLLLEKAEGGRLILPLGKLREAERARLGDVPTTVPRATESVVPVKGATPVPPRAAPTRFAAALAGHLVRLDNGALVPVPGPALNATQVYAIYFSAGWCGPCRAFTPALVDVYHQLKAQHPEFEVIFVSADRSERAMLDYMRDHRMPWPALGFQRGAGHDAVQAYRRDGIPNLVFVDGTGRVLAASYDDAGKYLGPRHVLREIERRLAR